MRIRIIYLPELVKYGINVVGGESERTIGFVVGKVTRSGNEI
jgi:hypothetical protein